MSDEMLVNNETAIVTVDGESHKITCREFLIKDDGTLVIYGKSGNICAFAPGSWEEVSISDNENDV